MWFVGTWFLFVVLFCFGLVWGVCLGGVLLLVLGYGFACVLFVFGLLFWFVD